MSKGRISQVCWPIPWTTAGKNVLCSSSEKPWNLLLQTSHDGNSHLLHAACSRASLSLESFPKVWFFESLLPRLKSVLLHCITCVLFTTVFSRGASGGVYQCSLLSLPALLFLAALRMATSRQSQTFHQSEWASAHTSGSKVFCPLSPSDPFTTMLPTHTGACLYELEISWDSGSQVVSSSQRRQCLCPQRVSVNTTLNWQEI